MADTVQIDQFLATVYLGDRACKSITIDGWKERVSIVVDEISRIRSKTGQWDFYNDENVVDGSLVFTGVKSFSITPSGPLPSDYIDLESVQAIDAVKGIFRVKFNVGGIVPATGEIRMQSIEIDAERVHIEDPKCPGVEVHE